MRPPLDNPKFRQSQSFFEQACAASRMHDLEAASALSRYGDHGPQISGCVRDHFPDFVKRDLRFWAHEVSRLSDLAYMHHPKWSRMSTMRHLASAVATRDGSGFYGPQPFRGA